MRTGEEKVNLFMARVAGTYECSVDEPLRLLDRLELAPAEK